jgi:NADH-quinone oxidoreductase subunit A
MLISKFVLKATTNKQKGEPYECGIPTTGQNMDTTKCRVTIYLQLLFLIFDVELVFLYPWAVVAKSMGWNRFYRNCHFLLILFVGFCMRIKKGALKWM